MKVSTMFRCLAVLYKPKQNSKTFKQLNHLTSLHLRYSTVWALIEQRKNIHLSF